MSSCWYDARWAAGRGFRPRRVWWNPHGARLGRSDDYGSTASDALIESVAEARSSLSRPSQASRAFVNRRVSPVAKRSMTRPVKVALISDASNAARSGFKPSDTSRCSTSWRHTPIWSARTSPASPVTVGSSVAPRS